MYRRFGDPELSCGGADRRAVLYDVLSQLHSPLLHVSLQKATLPALRCSILCSKSGGYVRNPLVLWSYCAFYADHPIVLNSAIRLIPEFDDCPLRRFHLKQLAAVDLIHNLSIMQNENP